jgi:hypothetical protein
MEIKQRLHLLLLALYQRRMRPVLRYLPATPHQPIEKKTVSTMVAPHVIGKLNPILDKKQLMRMVRHQRQSQ